jgi:hypothetical protein
MMTYTSDYDESDYQMDEAAREVAEVSWEAMNMEDVTIESTPRETKGELIRAQFPAWMQDDAGPIGSTVENTPMISYPRTWEPIDEHTPGPVVEFCDVSPIEIPRKKVA